MGGEFAIIPRLCERASERVCARACPVIGDSDFERSSPCLPGCTPTTLIPRFIVIVSGVHKMLPVKHNTDVQRGTWCAQMHADKMHLSALVRGWGGQMGALGGGGG